MEDRQARPQHLPHLIRKELTSMQSPSLTQTRVHIHIRVRLFKNAKEIANEQKDKRLKREYARSDELSQLIFWTDKGREGAAHIRQKMQQKSIA